jgi:hypothetical protein
MIDNVDKTILKWAGILLCTFMYVIFGGHLLNQGDLGFYVYWVLWFGFLFVWYKAVRNQFFVNEKKGEKDNEQTSK